MNRKSPRHNDLGSEARRKKREETLNNTGTPILDMKSSHKPPKTVADEEKTQSGIFGTCIFWGYADPSQAVLIPAQLAHPFRFQHYIFHMEKRQRKGA